MNTYKNKETHGNHTDTKGQTTVHNKELISLIEKKRAALLKVVAEHGMNSHIAIQHSQQLDKLINKYNRIQIKSLK